jgi:hypothetical protein
VRPPSARHLDRSHRASATLRRRLGRVEARIRLQRALDAGALLLVPGAALAALAVGAMKTGALATASLPLWLLAAASFPALGFFAGVLRRVPPLLPAQLVDRAHDLKSRVATALELTALPPAERTPFTEAAVADALARAEALSPARAMPLRAPRDLWPAAGASGLALLLCALEVPFPRALPPPPVRPPSVLDPDSLEGFRSELAEITAAEAPDPEVQSAARELNRILEDIADRRLDRTEALREITALERRLAEGRSADADLMDDALREMGRRLAGPSERATAASEALRDADAARAERALRALSDEVRTQAMTRAELAQLRQALERSAEERSAAEQAMERREDELQSLLERRRDEAAQEHEPSLLRQRQRELERLERDRAAVAEQRRRLERLRREMERAAEDLNRERRDAAAEELERGAEDLNRTAREQMSEEQRRQLEEQMRQLREMIRRQREQPQANGGQGQGQGQSGQGGGPQRRLQRFVLRAQGQGGQGARLRLPGQGQGSEGGQQRPQSGAQGQGQGSEGQQGGQGAQGGQGQAQGGQGQGQGQPGGEAALELTAGRGGDAVLELPGMGEGQGRGGRGEGGGLTGAGAGDQHDPNMLEDPTRLNSRAQNTRVEGQASEGPSRSEVILGAADRGFASSPYRRVYTDYSDHAEEVLEQDEIPPGYRFYVRRYFQLIRPRDGAAGDDAASAP